FGAKFDKISATAYYPTKPNDAIGGGSLSNVDIPKNSNSTIHFPFSINYTTSYDSDLSVLKDIAQKCGFLGSSESNLEVNYKVKTKVKVIAVSISPSFSSTASFACPLSESDLKGFLGSADLSSLGLGSLSSALGGGSSKRVVRRTLQRGGEEGTEGVDASEILRDEASRAVQKVLEAGWTVARRNLGIDAGDHDEATSSSLFRRTPIVVNAKHRTQPPPVTVAASADSSSSQGPSPSASSSDASDGSDKVFDPSQKRRIGTLWHGPGAPNPKFDQGE
ncbi:hypothetical protein JCM10212_004628, partial [Sporobolomyces blumeae]